MKFFLWTALLIVISFWILGYFYIKMKGDITAREHKLSMIKTKMKHKMAGLEKEKQKIEESIQKIAKEMDEHNGDAS
ncbi:MAG: hypothetical protein ABR542_02640 [Desulfonatronovibrio sp.]|nr:hypothetical protein [Desulfovibrionales bacterium]